MVYLYAYAYSWYDFVIHLSFKMDTEINLPKYD